MKEYDDAFRLEKTMLRLQTLTVEATQRARVRTNTLSDAGIRLYSQTVPMNFLQKQMPVQNTCLPLSHEVISGH